MLNLNPKEYNLMNSNGVLYLSSSFHFLLKILFQNRYGNKPTINTSSTDICKGKENTVKTPASRMRPRIMGIAVNTPIWKRNCVFRATVRAVFCITSALF
jgi:hypothetical protein